MELSHCYRFHSFFNTGFFFYCWIIFKENSAVTLLSKCGSIFQKTKYNVFLCNHTLIITPRYVYAISYP